MHLWPWVALLALAPAQPGGETYIVASDASRLTIDVGRAGIFQMFGHDHLIAADGLAGDVDWSSESPEQSRFVLRIDAASLRVADEDVSEDDRTAIQSDMESKALDLPSHPEIVFTSTAVEVRSSEGDTHRLRVTGSLALRGVEKSLEVPFVLEAGEDRLVATGELELESDEWGVPQISAVGGTVKTSEELTISFEIVAIR